ncbi:MAG: glycosyltransferase [Desulforhopalus sp.]|nr:glycosyltransferase [Desulforhopalus sp.]
MAINFRHILTTIWYRLTSPQYRLLLRSGLFDPDFYLENNPDVAASGAEPLAHYLTRGFAELRQPGPLFDARYYIHQVPSLDQGQSNPLLHYLTIGRYQGLRPNPLFDPEYLGRQSGDDDASQPDLFSRFLQGELPGMQQSSPSPYFDPHFYCLKYPDAAHLLSDPVAAYIHFLKVGRGENRQPSAYFDTAFYLDKTPVLRDMGLDPISHYCMFGCREFKSPSPVFDAAFYLRTYGPVENDDPFAHYLRNQGHDNRRPCAWFDPAFYKETYLSELGDAPPPLKHFLESGLREGLYPNRQIFDCAEKPLISVIVPVYNVEAAHLNNCIRSVLYQSYPHWQLCLADDCSTAPKVRPLLMDWAAANPRIKVTFLPENRGISLATNTAARLAEGSYLAFLDNDDELALDALETIAQRISTDPAKLYYSDEDLIGADGRQFSIFRKPGFNSELLLCHNYVTHLVVAQKELFDDVGGCDTDLNGAQDLDLFLKLSEKADAVLHIPKILYHWRASASSTSINHDQKHYADEAGRRAVAKAMARRCLPGDALFTDWKFFYRAKRSVKKDHLVSVVISWERAPSLMLPWLTGLLARAGYAVHQLLILATNRECAAIATTFGEKTGIATVCRIVAGDLNLAVHWPSLLPDIQGEFVTFASGSLENFSEEWLTALLEYGQLADVGLVSGRVDYPEGYEDIASPIPDCSRTSPFYFHHFLTGSSQLMNGLHCPQEAIGVSGDLCLIRSQLLKAMTPCDSADFPFIFAFTDISYRLIEQGKIHMYTPYCKATMAQDGIARRQLWPLAALQDEKARFQDKWSTFLKNGDPFYNIGIVTDNGISEDAFRHWLAGEGGCA